MVSFKKLWLKFRNFHFNLKQKLQGQKQRKFRDHDQHLVQKLNRKTKLPTLKQLSYVNKYLSKTENLLIRILSGILFISAICLLINLYWTNSVLVPQKGGVYTEGLAGAPRYINPLFANANDVDLDLTALVFSGLFKYTDKGIEKDLAENYEISTDQLTYTVKLKENVFWHDGEKLTADDVIFTFNRLTNNQVKTPLYFNFQGIKIEKIDDLSIKFILSKPFAPFLESLTVGIIPQYLWQNTLPENMLMAEYNLKPIGSGPYKFESLTKDKNGKLKSFKLQANEQYYAGAPFVKELNLKFHDNFEQAVEALNNKKVDGISYLPKEIRARIINNRNINFNILNLPQYTSVFFNYANNPILKDVTIRKILSHAVNKEKIVNEILNAEAQIIDSCVLPNTLGYKEDLVKYPFNVSHAKEQLEKLSWKLADYKKEIPKTDDETEATVTAEEVYPYPVRKKNDRYLEFNLTTVNQPENVKIAKELQKEWQLIGAKVNLNIVSLDEIPTVIKNRNYDALLYGQILGNDPDPYPFWHSSQRSYPGLNFTSFNNSEADKLLEDARKTSDDQARAEKYQKFQELLTKDSPAIFLFNPTYTYPQNKKIKGFNTSQIIIPANRFSQINEWYIKTDRVWARN